MKYDFTSIIDRRGMDATAVEAVGHPILMEGALAELLSRFSNRCSRAEHILASLPF